MPCYYCKKGIIFGRTHTHHRGVAGGRWKKRAPKKQRIFRVNLQPVHIMLESKDERARLASRSKRVKLCTKCIKRIKKDTAEGKKPFLMLINKEIKSAKSKVKTSKSK